MDNKLIIEVTEDGNKYITIDYYIENVKDQFVKLTSKEVEKYRQSKDYNFEKMEESEFIFQLSDIPLKYGLTIKKFRKKRGLSLDELAEKMGNYNKSVISKIENGKDMRITTWHKFVEVLGIEMHIKEKGGHQDLQLS
jgi:ribosome-binding protein aMBF1 (putative translation factor)